jgi:hypothetical protein
VIIFFKEVKQSIEAPSHGGDAGGKETLGLRCKTPLGPLKEQMMNDYLSAGILENFC